MLPPLVTNSTQAIVRRLNDLTAILGNITGDGKTTRVSKAGRSIMISSISRPPGAATPSEDVNLPFTVIQKNDTTLTLLGYHEDEGRYWANKIIAGLVTTTVAEQDITVTADGQLYADITQSAGVYSIAFVTGTMPAQVAGHYYVELGIVGFADAKITRWQPTYPGGHIEVKGRIV